MKNDLLRTMAIAALLALPFTSSATIFFADTFDSGSTLNQTPATPAPGTTSYETAIGVAGGSWSIAPHDLSLSFPGANNVLGEVYALFAPVTSPVSLNYLGDYITLTVVFTNRANINSGLDTQNSSINVGLFYATNMPNQGNIVLGSGTNNTSTGGTMNWVGYSARIVNNASGSCMLFTRPQQSGNGTTAQNQDLLFNNASSGQAFNNPAGASLGTTTGGATNLTQGGTYTLTLTICRIGLNTDTYGITNTLYNGVGTGGSAVFTQGQTASETDFPTHTFNGMAFGWRNASSGVQTSMVDIASIVVDGFESTVGPSPIDITSQPMPVRVVTNGSCAFSVSAAVFNPAYQWHRNGVDLHDSGNISGATNSTLIISPAGPADEVSGANGYYVTIWGTDAIPTNSVTNSLTLVAATDLFWSGAGNIWDASTNANWLDLDNNPVGFSFGDSVTFDDTGSANPMVTLTGSYLSAASVTVAGSTAYTFSGTGSFAGPGSLTYTGPGQLTINNTNSYTGPTLVSNGTLQINGALNASSAVAVSSDGVLAGTGTVNGPVTIDARSTLAPGAVSLGALNLSSNLDLRGNVKIRVNRSGFTSDEAVVTGSLNNNGAGMVIVTNTGAALQAGDIFHPFNKAITGGANLKVVGAGVAWTNKLALNGTISVVDTNPPGFWWIVSGGTNLVIGWPAIWTGATLQSNSAGLLFPANWCAVPDSDKTNVITVPIDHAQTNVFYRLLAP